MRRARRLTWLFVFLAWPVSAQQRPLETQDPDPIGEGLMMVEMGVLHVRELTLPAAGLAGHLTTVPSLGLSFGIGGIAEIQIDHVSTQLFRVTDRFTPAGPRPPTFMGDSTSSFDDVVIGAKARLYSERGRRPALAFHFSTKLPNASTESGLGLDTMDFHNSLLLGKSVGPVRLVGNIGVGILGDPTTVARQNDVVIYGASAVVAVSPALELVGEVNGRRNTRDRAVPPGTDSSGYVRVGLRKSLGAIRLDGAVIAGLHEEDGSVGATVGLTWLFPGFGDP